MKEVELPEELMRGRAGFSKEALYINKSASKQSDPSSLDKNRLETRRRIEDIQAQRELDSEINSF